jgi:DNA polymerase elongation subunit (family B)
MYEEMEVSYYDLPNYTDDYDVWDETLNEWVDYKQSIYTKTAFPNIETANQQLTAITMRCRNRSYVLGYKDFATSDPNVYYVQCKDEYELIQQFLSCWRELDPDIVTGWNIEFFDIPYLINRIRNLMGEKEAKKLSPWGFIDERTIESFGKENKVYGLPGVSILDYLQLYRKFSYSNHESYKLDYIAFIELGEKKVDTSEFSSLNDLYHRDHQKFIEYNIKDAILVDKLDDKLKLLEQVMALAYDAKVNYVDTLTTVRAWDVMIHNYLLDRNIVIPQMKKHSMDKPLIGGYVKDVKTGLSEWVVSFDLNSLYPHLIMQYNISPETFVQRYEEFESIDQLLISDNNYGDPLIAVTANGCAYRTEKQGFLPEMMERIYNDRVVYKQKMIEAKQRYEKTKSKEDEKLIARYHNFQMAKKIQLNSAYGALGNQYFRWFNFDHAEAITSSGQLSIRWIEQKINQYMNKLLKTNKVDYVIASDTDSIYLEMKSIVDMIDTTDTLKIVSALDQFCEKKIQPFLDKSYQELADKMSAYQQKMFMKRETIADKGIWTGKKHYILNAWNVEGVQYAEPKLKIQGIEAVRSSTPAACRENIKKALHIIMNGNEKDLIRFVDKFREEFNHLPFESVAFPRGVNNVEEYADKHSIFKKATPIAVRGALLFNHFLKKMDINYIPPITSGDKVKFAYLTLPNPIQSNVISTPGEMPKEFNLNKYIDRSLQFEKAFLEPLKYITNSINWQTEDISTLEGFFE